MVAVVDTVNVVDWPAFTLRLAGVAAIEKSGCAAHELNLNEAMRVRQLKLPLFGMYSVVYQNVQSSAGSIRMAE